MATGNQGTILTSSEGINWQSQYSGTSSSILDITNNSIMWVAVGWSGTIVTSDDGISWKKHDSNYSGLLWKISWFKSQWIATGDSGTILTSNCYTEIKSQNTHVIIIAGGGNSNDPLQETTNQNANLAYQTLRQRGIAVDNIKYFNPIPQDANGDGIIDTVAGVPTTESIKQAVTRWASR